MVKKSLIVSILGLVILAVFVAKSVRSVGTNLEPIATPSSTPYHQINPKDDPIDVIKLWNIINEWRVSLNLPKYIKDDRLCTIAEKRAIEIQTTYSHTKFERDYANYPYVIQENIGTCTDAQMCLEKWLNSPPHKATLQKWSYSCIACDNWYCTQVFSNFTR